MGDRTNISWADASWNPVTGCDAVSPGCDHCYAESIATRFAGTPAYPRGFKVTLHPRRLDQPLRWPRPRLVFVNSMSDLFHDEIPTDYIARVFAVMAVAPQHTFQVLTKRPGRMRSLLLSEEFHAAVARSVDALGMVVGAGGRVRARELDRSLVGVWPLPNVWLGVSAEDQKWADVRIPVLLSTPAAVRFVSAEPLLGPIDFSGPLVDGHRPRLSYWLTGRPGFTGPGGGSLEVGPRLDWVIVGGESGSGARPMHPDWARAIRDQCVAAGVPFHFKQWGAYLPVPVVDADVASGRAYDLPGGGRNAAVIRRQPERAFRSGVTVPMQPGDTNGHGTLLDVDTMALRVGSKVAGRDLDGEVWDEFPAAAVAR